MKHGEYQAQHDSLVIDQFPPIPAFPVHARESKRFQDYLGPSAPPFRKRVWNFATISTCPKTIYVKKKDFFLFIFVAQLLIYFNSGKEVPITMLLIATIDPILRANLQQTLT